MLQRVLAAAAIAAACVAVPPAVAQAAPLTPGALTADRLTDPLGLASARPAFGWTLNGDGRNRSQSAYQVIVTQGDQTVWDSGEVRSPASANVPYAGPALESGTQYRWKVRVWDEAGRPSDYSAPATLETALLTNADWSAAKWIAAPSDDLNLSGARWIWHEDGTQNMPAMTRYLRATVDLATAPSSGRFLFTVDDEAAVYVNGTLVIDTKSIRDADENAWQKAQLVDVPLKAGANTIAVQAKNRLNGSGAATPGAFIGRLQAGGQTMALSWKSNANAPAGWEQPGFDDSAWQAARELATYGSGPWGSNVSLPSQPSPYLRKDFTADKTVAQARLYVSALGLYELSINGQKVGDRVLAPGWTEYTKRVPAQTYDVTGLVKPGENAIGAVLGEGWYAGRLQGGRKWGTNPALIAQLKITYADGTTTRVVTDDSWQTGTGGLRASSIYDGETFDARLERANWNQPGFDGGWRNAVLRNETMTIEPDRSPPIRVIETLVPKTVTTPKPGVTVYDLGQNFAGWARVKATGAAGTQLKLRFGEILNDDGTVHTANLRSALQTDTFTLRGGGQETHEPRFTYHGFRYVEVTGGTVDSLEGRVVTSDLPEFGTFTSSNALVNQIQSAIRWGQWSNFLAVPTDASQRDERLGWTGDIQAFATTGTFNGDASHYLGQWMQTLRDSQSANGAFPDVAPKTCCGEGVAGWGDAGTVVPFALYKRYGDVRVLRENYDAMERWIAYLRANSTNLIRPNSGYGDWLAVDNTAQDFIATAFFAYSTDLVRQAATILGEDADAASYASLHAQIKSAFANRWVRADGTVGTGSQTSYVLALKFGLVPDDLEQRAFDRLADDVAHRGNHLSTGFLGTPFLLNVLEDGGRADLAHELLVQDTYPSWGYMLSRGGTTIWERWDGIKPDGTLQDLGMNSFNHFGLGSIGDWLYDEVGGLAPLEPGYKKLLVAPSTGDLGSASSSVKTAYGPARTAWSKDAAGRLTIDVDVPVNTRAELRLPLADGQVVFENGKPAAEQPGVVHKGTANGVATYEVGSGSYRFLAAVSNATSVNGDVAGTVPPTLALSVGPVTLGALVPGVPRTYDGEARATVTSTAGEAALSVHDPSATATGRLVNGSFALAQPLRIDGKAVGGSSSPTPLHTWTGPVSNGAKTLTFAQDVGADEPLRTGSYSKTLTFTLSTTAP
ncbi:family 78 glycoside hydrolase catalytic domain [Solirubrobacter sp. CPCC 204708]|uniref:alpha-L-rhamnosidase n=1 Tax=Solirubrobacter deserti TaxID=2282478 RepID=A0ABT4RSU5_9ACTN|nr:alpha-L-rhamnosidase [Solirubrobacter deserti]MBE2316363.1 family 78 glycoside hydrolase catalytic domain [Solirubrobacter deserti]MDA0141557.1 glycoside hydrolase family 78 protein [Solirubrobacter deserti]